MGGEIDRLKGRFFFARAVYDLSDTGMSPFDKFGRRACVCAWRVCATWGHTALY